jgi:flagella basal body P-ring formation protein FlgA
MSNIKIFLTFLLFLTLFSSKSYSQAFDNSYIENFAKNYLQQQIEKPTDGKLSIKINKIDPRIKIKNCQSPLKANIPEINKSRNVNIKITCTDSTPWKIYLTAKVAITVPVVIAKQAIDKGTLLNRQNVTIAYRDSLKIRGTHINNLSQVIGSKAKRKITKGRSITRKNVCVVCKGDNVSIMAKSKNFLIKTQGIALANGSIGDQVKIKNSRSGKTITAKVNAINKVVINL